MASKNSRLARLASYVDTSGSYTQASGIAVYNTVAQLPLVGNEAGDMAFVDSSDKLYIYSGEGWYNIALVNQTPTITSGGNASYTLAKDGTPIVITLEASDPEGTPITWSYSVTSGSLGNTATVSQADNVFTITPSTNSNDAGEFSITFTASDGVNLATSVSSFTLIFNLPAIELLVVGGGGGGGNTVAGGGGAGGYRYFNNQPIAVNITYDIVVGNGGNGSTNGSNKGSSGTASTFIPYGTAWIISAAGGGGGGSRSNYDGIAGGSGGGGAYVGGPGYNNIIAAGNTPATTPSQGNAGGLAGSDTGGGGGGAGGVGQNSPGQTAGGAGGVGAITTIISASAATTYSVGQVVGSDVYFAGGGGGGANQSKGVGGVGGHGGGATGSHTGAGGGGTPNTGGGGGGGAYTGGYQNGGSGGSGVVIVRYSEDFPAAITTGSPIYYVENNYRHYIFKTNGSINFPS